MTLEEAKKRLPPMWVVYDHPRDYPTSYVARKWYGENPTDEMLMSESLEQLEDDLAAAGLVKFARNDEDEPQIVGTWI